MVFCFTSKFKLYKKGGNGLNSYGYIKKIKNMTFFFSFDSSKIILFYFDCYLESSSVRFKTFNKFQSNYVKNLLGFDFV